MGVEGMKSYPLTPLLQRIADEAVKYDGDGYSTDIDLSMFIGEHYISIRYSPTYFESDLIRSTAGYPIWKENLMISNDTFRKMKTILLLRNICYTLISNNYIDSITIHLTSEYTKELLNKDMGGFVRGWL